MNHEQISYGSLGRAYQILIALADEEENENEACTEDSLAAEPVQAGSQQNESTDVRKVVQNVQ